MEINQSTKVNGSVILILLLVVTILVLCCTLLYLSVTFDKLARYVNYYCLNESVVVDRYFLKQSAKPTWFAESGLNVS